MTPLFLLRRQPRLKNEGTERKKMDRQDVENQMTQCPHWSPESFQIDGE